MAPRRTRVLERGFVVLVRPEGVGGARTTTLGGGQAWPTLEGVEALVEVLRAAYA